MNAECRRILAEVSAYLDGDLDEAACETIERHCATCTSCAEFVDGLKKTVGLCRRLGATPLPPAVLDRARASVRRLLAEQTPDD